MAEAPKGPRVQVVTPFGDASWTFLSEPDRYGNYKATVLCDPAEAQELKDQMESLGAKYKIACEALDCKVDEVLTTCVKEIDGQIAIRAKLRSEVKSRSGQMIRQRPRVVGPKGEPFEGAVYPGSRIRVSGLAKVTYIAKEDGKRVIYVSIDLKAAQVAKVADPNDRFADVFDEVDVFDAPAEGETVGDF